MSALLILSNTPPHRLRGAPLVLACLGRGPVSVVRWPLSLLVLEVCLAPAGPNAALQARLAAGARYERTLAAVACKRLFGEAPAPEP